MIDLRSDFCAPPTDEMWTAMRDGSEETVAKLELTVGFELGKEAAVFCPTCTAANLAALMALGERGRAAIVEANAHVLVSEGGGSRSIASAPIPTPMPPASTASTPTPGSRCTTTRSGMWRAPIFRDRGRP